MSNLKFGIIQGRLTQSPPGCLQWFPQQEWRSEFAKASELGISFIELILLPEIYTPILCFFLFMIISILARKMFYKN